MSVTPACRLPTSIDKRRQLVVVVCGGHTQVHFNRDLYLLGRPTVTSCHLHLQLDLISDFCELYGNSRNNKKYFLLQFFIGEADNCKNEIQTSKRFFWPEKWFLKKVTHFSFFCTNHSSGLLCSCKRFCVVDFWPLFRFSASQKLLSLLQE